ncbi:MAG: hypothetical protein IIX42_08330 [Alistipes sp.]|nr:hypothetical protein [Alistipes sp.]
MKTYILHYSLLDNSGEVSIFCNAPYKALSDAVRAQNKIIDDWVANHSNISIETIGYFIGATQIDSIEEIQTSIEEFDI